MTKASEHQTQGTTGNEIDKVPNFGSKVERVLRRVLIGSAAAFLAASAGPVLAEPSPSQVTLAVDSQSNNGTSANSAFVIESGSAEPASESEENPARQWLTKHLTNPKFSFVELLSTNSDPVRSRKLIADTDGNGIPDIYLYIVGKSIVIATIDSDQQIVSEIGTFTANEKEMDLLDSVRIFPQEDQPLLLEFLPQIHNAIDDKTEEGNESYSDQSKLIGAASSREASVHAVENLVTMILGEEFRQSNEGKGLIASSYFFERFIRKDSPLMEQLVPTKGQPPNFYPELLEDIDQRDISDFARKLQIVFQNLLESSLEKMANGAQLDTLSPARQKLLSLARNPNNAIHLSEEGANGLPDALVFYILTHLDEIKTGNIDPNGIYGELNRLLSEVNDELAKRYWNIAIGQFFEQGDTGALASLIDFLTSDAGVRPALTDEEMSQISPELTVANAKQLAEKLRAMDIEGAKQILAEIDPSTVTRQITTTSDWQLKLVGGEGVPVFLQKVEADNAKKFAEVCIQLANEAIIAFDYKSNPGEAPKHKWEIKHSEDVIAMVEANGEIIVTFVRTENHNDETLPGYQATFKPGQSDTKGQVNVELMPMLWNKTTQEVIRVDDILTKIKHDWIFDPEVVTKLLEGYVARLTQVSQ